jgi:hypothetical protein
MEKARTSEDAVPSPPQYLGQECNDIGGTYSFDTTLGEYFCRYYPQGPDYFSSDDSNAGLWKWGIAVCVAAKPNVCS